MKITRNQANFLADLSTQIKEHYGYNIGYLNPAIALPMDPGVDFLIFEDPEGEEEDNLQCFHKGDVRDQMMGNIVVRTINQEPDHDEEVEKLFKKISDDILDGVIAFDPTVTKEVDDIRVTITKKRFPDHVGDVFETNIFTERYGTVYTYPIICEHAKIDKKFKIAKELIDDNWPQPSPKPEPKKSPDWFNKFKEWFL